MICYKLVVELVASEPLLEVVNFGFLKLLANL